MHRGGGGLQLTYRSEGQRTVFMSSLQMARREARVRPPTLSSSAAGIAPGTSSARCNRNDVVTANIFPIKIVLIARPPNLSSSAAGIEPGTSSTRCNRNDVDTANVISN